jgi:hypothetical protein
MTKLVEEILTGNYNFLTLIIPRLAITDWQLVSGDYNCAADSKKTTDPTLMIPSIPTGTVSDTT